MADHGFADAQIEYIRNENTLQTGALRRDIEGITTMAQAAFSQPRTKIMEFTSVATQNAARVDTGVIDMNNLKGELGVKMTDRRQV